MLKIGNHRFYHWSANRLDEIEKDYPMESITDISKSLFQNRSEIMGQAALALIEKKFGHLLDQRYCECPHCNRRIKAKSEKVRREIDTVVGPVTLYRPYFYCTTCCFRFLSIGRRVGAFQPESTAGYPRIRSVVNGRDAL